MSSLLHGFKTNVSRLEHSLDSPSIPWKPLVQVLLIFNYFFETYISLRQYRLYDLTSPPAELAQHVDAETFDKSQRYGKDKARFGFVKNALETSVELAIVHYDGLAFVWKLAGQVLAQAGVRDTEIPHSIAFMIIMYVLQQPLSIAIALYSNFVVEARHGFNKMTISTYVSDTIKGWGLGLVLGCPIMAGLIKVIRWAGDSFVAYVVGFLLAFQITAMVLYPTLIQPLFNKLTPLEEGPLKDRVVALASKLRFPLKHLYKIDGSKRSAHSNAYFFGVIPGGNKHIVIFDTLIEKSTKDEIEAVLAHELGHWAHSDPAKLLLLSQAQILFTMSVFALFIHNKSLFEAFGFAVIPTASLAKLANAAAEAVGYGQLEHAKKVAVDYLPIVIGLELFQWVLSPSDALLRFGVNSAVRSMEYAADDFAARLERPEPTAEELKLASAGPDSDGKAAEAPNREPYTTLLGKALIKLHIQNLSTMHHDSLYATYHYSHPTLSERLQRLSELSSKKK